MASVSLRGVNKTFSGGHVAVHDVDLDVADGELMVLVGPSGCGKSTILRLVAGLEQPTEGHVLLDDVDVTDVSTQQRDIAMVFQSYALYPHKTVRDNLAFGLKMAGTAREVITERVTEIARVLDIEPLLARKPSQLSGGQRQRVALGRALVRRPKAFLLDEPLSNLDATLRLTMRAELARIHQRFGTTTLYVTHDQQEAMTLGARVAVMHAGRIEQLGPPLEVFHRPATRFVAGFIGSPPMNFFRCNAKIESGELVLHHALFELRQPSGSNLSEIPPLVDVGIRPHDFELVATDVAELRGLVEVVETLGNETIVHVAREGHRFVAVLRSDTPVHHGDSIGFRIARQRIHLFDSRTGLRLGSLGEA